MTKTYFLGRGSVLRIQDGAGSVVRVQSGGVWLTQEGDSRDYYLAEGSTLRLSGNGLALAQATRPSSVSLSAAQPAANGRFWSWLFAPQVRPMAVSL